MRTISDIFTLGQEAKSRVRELYELLENEVNEEANLDDLDTTSKTSIWSLWLYVFAAMSWLLEGVFNAFKKETVQIIDASIAGTDRWLAAEVRKYQHGDTLIFNEDTYKYDYPTVDSEKQIVKRVAVVSGVGLTTVKVAKEVDEVPVALTTEELNGLRAYVNLKQWAGSNIDTVSYASDKIKLPIDVYFNALTPLSTIQQRVEAAVLAYLANLDFNGTVYLSKVVDAIQAVEGVVDVTLSNVEARSDLGSFSPVDRIYNPLSGYVEIDPDFSLEDTINYTASNG